MVAHYVQRIHSSYLFLQLIRSTVLLLLMALVLAGTLAAQDYKDAKRAEAQQLFNEGKQLVHLGTKESLEAAIRKFAEAIPLFHVLKDISDEAAALNNIGFIYDDLGEKPKALDYYTQSLVLRRAAGDHKGEAETLNNIGAVYDSMGERQKALDYYLQALPLRRVVRDREGEAITLSNIGVVYDSQGDKQKALDYLTQALAVFRTTRDLKGEATTLGNIGAVYDGLGEKRKAVDYYMKALPLKRFVRDLGGEAETLNNIGFLYSSLGEKQEALDYYTRALLLFRAVGDSLNEATTLSNIGSVYQSLGERQKALDRYALALPLQRRVGDREGEAATLNNIGSLYNSLGEKQKALDYYAQALPLERAVGDREGEAITLSNSAHLEYDRNNLSEARARIETALDIIESLRTKIASQESRASFFATKQDYYEFYIDLLMSLHKQEPSSGYDGKALLASERGRARSLLELLAEAGADIRQGVDSELVERERSLQRQLNARAQRQVQFLSGPHTAEQAKAVAKGIEDLTTEFQQVEAQIRQTSPHYAALTQPRPVALGEIQTQVLDADTLLLEYSLGAKRSYLWAVSQTGINGYELPKRSEIEAAALQFRELLTTPNRIYLETDQKEPVAAIMSDVLVQEKLEIASHLSRMLLQPVAGQLGQKRLVIVADGALQYVPFAALPDPVPIAQDAKSKQPLIVQHEIVNLPSVSVLATLRGELTSRKPAPKDLAVLADPVFYPEDERVRRKARHKKSERRNVTSVERVGRSQNIKQAMQETKPRRDGARLVRLKGSRKEAEKILALVAESRAKSAFDFEASRNLVSSGQLSSYRYVHFATHGLLDNIHPELTAVVLSLVDENGNPQDGYVRAHEIYNLIFRADVVVLSGCQTGLGQEVKGEGLIGLTRGFMYAGAARVVVSLWSVDDDATAELMTSFYRSMLKDHKPPAEALRIAQIDMLKQRRWQAPHYWAAFIMQGEWH